MNPSIKPTGHNILIAPLAWEKETEWGFQLAATESSQSAVMEKAGRQYGVLAAIGPQAWKAHAVPLAARINDEKVLADWAQLGDTVMYSRYAGKAIYDPLDGKEYYLIHDEDVLAVLPHNDDWVWDPTEREKKL